MLARPAVSGLAPVAPNDRVEYLDVLRGIALFGVLWSNLNDWYGTLEPSSAFSHLLSLTQDWLVESRFYTLLGFLFGIGFAIQLTRTEQKGQDVRSLFYRRMLVLLGLGLVHGLLIWRGDVLAEYALMGFVLVAYRRLPPRQLLIAAAATYLIPAYIVVLVLNRALGLPGPISFYSPQVESIYAHGTLAQIATVRVHQYLNLGNSPFIFNRFLVLFLLGLWAYRVDLIGRLGCRRRLLLLLLASAVLCTVFSGFLYQALPRWWPADGAGDVTWRDLRFWSPQPIVRWMSEDLLTWANAAVYAIALLLLMSFPFWAKLLKPLASVGRMTLTTYLAQSLICTTLFYSYGFGLYGRVSYAGTLAISLIIFSLQTMLSVWWLKRFRFGPAEWLWRSLAYGKMQSWRMVPTNTVGVTAMAATDPPKSV
jgi:uncharacterized protein